MTGYRISYSGGTDQGSVDVGASVTDQTITIPQPQRPLTYSISIVTLSSQLPSSVVGSMIVTVGKQNTTRFLFCTGILHITYSNNYHYQTNRPWKEKINNLNSISFHYVISLFIFLVPWYIFVIVKRHDKELLNCHFSLQGSDPITSQTDTPTTISTSKYIVE